MVIKYPPRNYSNYEILLMASVLLVEWWIELDHIWRNTEARRFCNDL
jgi:hypothetical protein